MHFQTAKDLQIGKFCDKEPPSPTVGIAASAIIRYS